MGISELGKLDTNIISPLGDMFGDSDGVCQFEQDLREAMSDPRTAVIDLERVRHMDADFYWRLLGLQHKLKEKGKEVILANLQPEIEEVLKRSGYSELFHYSIVIPAHPK